MTHAIRSCTLTFSLVVLSAGLTSAQSAATQVEPATSAAPIANVYVGTTKGIYFYDASTTGKVTLTSTKPDATQAGLLIGVTGNYLITLGTYIIHSYQLASTGEIGKQISSINTLNYNDSGDCYGSVQGTQFGSLNHQGRNVYVVFPPNPGYCAASIQTYDISKSGDLSFNGAIMTGGDGENGLFQAPTIIANDTFAYAASNFTCCGGAPPGWNGYVLGSNGEMQNWSFNLSNIITEPAGYYPFYVTADPTNHLAAIVATENFDPQTYSVARLASYAVNSQGDLSTTSTAVNMPYTNVDTTACCEQMSLNMSPSGKLLAVAGPLGLQMFHFNGAAPITPYSGVLTSDDIIRVHWDDSNHLFALSGTTKKLYVFTVTPTEITKVPGSPFTIPTGTPNALIVVPK
jgi:hypothetical protein